MFRRVLVPLDGSNFAEIAVPVAVRLARLARAELEFALVHEPELVAALGVEGVVVAEDEALRRQRETRYLHEVIDRCATRTTARISTQLLDGEPGPTLAAEIGSWQPDLVVLSTHGRGPLSRMWLGSVTDYLLRHVSVPLLVLKPRDAVDWQEPDLHLRSILVGWDLSPVGEAILEPVVDLARLTGAKIELVHVIETALTPAFDARLIELQSDEAARKLAGVVDRLRNQCLTVEAQVVFGVAAASTLVELVAQDGHDLVALTTHGRSGVTRALLGSVADKVIRASDKPVLVVRPAASGGST